MSYAIVYSSKTGNTKILADTLHDCLPQEGCDYFGIPDPAAMEADTLYVGFWTDKGNADVRTPAVRRDEKAADPSAQSGCHDREF